MTADRAIKEPCRVATGANITLSGLQTIDGVALGAGDRVLVRAQTTPSENGIYEAASGSWSRAGDMDGTGEAIGGVQLIVTSGEARAGRGYRIAGEGAITIGSTAIRFAPAADSVRAADYGFGAPGNSASVNAAALQRAVDRGGTVYLPETDGSIEFDDAVTIPLGTVLIGAGIDRTQLSCTGALAFHYQADDIAADLTGPKFAEFTLVCADSAIKLNDAGGGFDGSPVQSTIMRPRFERVRLLGPGSDEAGTIGVELNKVFSAVIDQCEVVGFLIGVKTLGCDFPAIVNRSRIWQCGILVQCESDGSFGSGMLIDGADLLAPDISFIKSSDHHLIVRDCYLEKGVSDPLTGPALDIAHDYMTSFTGNRLELPSAYSPVLLSVTGEGTSFVFERNSHGGEAWGTSEWNGDNDARCLFTNVREQKILFRDNAMPVAIPFNNGLDSLPRDDWRTPWLFGPDLPSLSSMTYSATVRAQDGAYLIPAIAAGGSAIAVSDQTREAAGDLEIRILAKASVDGTILGAAYYAGGSFGDYVGTALTEDFAWYSLFSPTGVDPLDRIELLNQDLDTHGDVFVRQIVVERG